MRRRHALASLASLLAAGCLGAERPEDAGPVRTEGSTGQQFSTRTRTPTPEPTATETATPTEAPEPEETETETPRDEAVAAGEDALETVRDELTDAVETFAADGDLTSVDTTSTGFDARSVLLSLDAAQRALVAAEADVVDDQRERLQRLSTVERFLTHVTLAQSYLVDTYAEFRDLDSALTTDLDAAEDAEDSFYSTLEEATDPIMTLKNDVEGDAVESADLLDDDSYEDKLDQLDTERDVFRTTAEGVNRMVKGMDELADAREEEDDDNDDEAEDHAEEAREEFDEAIEKFDDAARDAPQDTIEEDLERLLDIADDKYDEADDF